MFNSTCYTKDVRAGTTSAKSGARVGARGVRAIVRGMRCTSFSRGVRCEPCGETFISIVYLLGPAHRIVTNCKTICRSI